MSNQQSNATRGMLPKMEILIILVFFFSFIIWAASKCSATEIQDQFAEITNDPETSEAIIAPVDTTITVDPYGGTPLPPANPPATDATANPTPGTPSGSTTTLTTPTNTDPSTAASKLFITIDGLNMRTGPHLDSTVILKLPLFEEVWFLNEVTDSTQRISLGTEIANEPWVKIKHKKGRVGWVYGAGVNYYRKARLAQ